MERQMENSEVITRDFKGVWIPKEIWLDTRLNALDKIILTEIDSLCSDEKGCYASNDYIAEFCQCSKTKVSTAISKLIELGYLYVESFDGRQRVLKSCLSNFERHPFKNCKAPIQKVKGANQINNNIINNKAINKKERKKDVISAEKTRAKKAASAPSKKQSFDAIIDAYTENEELRAELKEHLKTRKAKKATLTDHAIELSLKELDKHGKNDAEKILIVQTAIMSGWTTFYPLKEKQAFKSTNSSQSRRRSSVGDDFDASYDLDAYESNYMYI